MKLLKYTMIAVASLTASVALTTVPAKLTAAAPVFGWKAFWQRLANILLRALELYLKQVIERGYFLAPVPANPILTHFNSQSDIAAAAKNGLIYDGHSLTIPQDIVLYVKDDIGVALQKGEYSVDGKGNFNFVLVRVEHPVPSTTFPLPDGTE